MEFYFWQKYWESGLFEHIHDIFGNRISIIFNTRHFKPSLLSFMKVMGAVESEPDKEEGNFWFSNTGLPLNDNYRPIFQKYFEVRRTADFFGEI